MPSPLAHGSLSGYRVARLPGPLASPRPSSLGSAPAREVAVPSSSSTRRHGGDDDELRAEDVVVLDVGLDALGGMGDVDAEVLLSPPIGGSPSRGVSVLRARWW
jgi:hypothetical protein